MDQGLLSVRGWESLPEDRLSEAGLFWALTLPKGPFPHLYPDGNEPVFFQGPLVLRNFVMSIKDSGQSCQGCTENAHHS